MITVKDVYNQLNELADVKLAEKWDNVGLMLGDNNSNVNKVLVCLDVTTKVVKEAIDNNVDLIVSHHPLIFKPLKSLDFTDDFKSNIIRDLIKNNINVYAIHTNLDSSIDGLNDYILKKLGILEYKILDFDEEKNCGIGRLFKLNEEKNLKDFIEDLKLKLKILNLRVISDDLNKKIKKVALINGSAMSYWRKAKKEKVDLFITGDVGYHDALDALESGLNIIDFGHYESEHFFYEILIEELKDKNLEFLIFNRGPVFKFY